MFAAMLSNFEITADRTEDTLLKALSAAMRARGFTLLGIVAMHEEEGSLVTFGDAETTQSVEFAGILRCLAEQIELNQDAPADQARDARAGILAIRLLMIREFPRRCRITCFSRAERASVRFPLHFRMDARQMYEGFSMNPIISKWPFKKGLQDLGNGCYAYLQPDGSWGWSNAGLIVDSGAVAAGRYSVRPQLTREMLATMRRAEPAATRNRAPLVNTHSNGDHCFGNELVEGAEIIASKGATRRCVTTAAPAPGRAETQRGRDGRDRRVLRAHLRSLRFRGHQHADADHHLRRVSSNGGSATRPCG